MTVQVIGTREVPVRDLTPLPGNPRRGNVAEIRKSVARLGQYRTVVVRDTGDALVVLAGNHTVKAIEAEGHETARCEVIQCSDDEARRISLADNRLGELPDPETGERYDSEALAVILASLDGDLEGTGWDVYDLDEIADALGRDEPGSGGTPPPEERPSLADRFLIPPFDVLDARQGWWQSRKKAWIGLGIRSELGRSARDGSGDPVPGGAGPGSVRRDMNKYSRARGGGLTFKGQDSLNRIMHEG